MGCAGSKTVATAHGQPDGQNRYPRQQHPIRVINQPVQQTAQKPVAKVQAQTPPILQNEPTEIEITHVEINEQILTRYVELEAKIRSGETQNLIQTYKEKCSRKDDLDVTVKQLHKHYMECTKQTAKEKADVDNMHEPTVRSFFKDQTQFDAQLTKEQEEYVDALNKQEIAKTEWEGVTKQRDNVVMEIEAMKANTEDLLSVHKEQDQLLASIFNGKYGSDNEYKLESQLDVLLDRKQRIGVARHKWHNARALMHHACNQLAFASRRWQDLARPEYWSNNQVKYNMATETRNNLIAASQNIAGAQRYLHSIAFPYCKPDEVETLNKAITNIYTDLWSGERHAHAMKCYITTHKRAAALIQWFDNVVSTTIAADLKKAAGSVAAKEKELRQERLSLIMSKIKGVLPDAKIDLPAATESLSESDFEDTEEKELVDAMQPEMVSSLESGEQVDENGEKVVPPTTEGVAPPVDQTALEAPTPLPLGELAPLPTEEDLFGNIDEIKKQHEIEMEEFQKAQDVNKARMDQGLQEKLRRRRSRKARQEQHEKQTQELTGAD